MDPQQTVCEQCMSRCSLMYIMLVLLLLTLTRVYAGSHSLVGVSGGMGSHSCCSSCGSHSSLVGPCSTDMGGSKYDSGSVVMVVAATSKRCVNQRRNSTRKALGHHQHQPQPTLCMKASLPQGVSDAGMTGTSSWSTSLLLQLLLILPACELPCAKLVTWRAATCASEGASVVQPAVAPAVVVLVVLLLLRVLRAGCTCCHTSARARLVAARSALLRGAVAATAAMGCSACPRSRASCRACSTHLSVLMLLMSGSCSASARLACSGCSCSSGGGTGKRQPCACRCCLTAAVKNERPPKPGRGTEGMFVGDGFDTATACLLWQDEKKMICCF